MENKKPEKYSYSGHLQENNAYLRKSVVEEARISNIQCLQDDFLTK